MPGVNSKQTVQQQGNGEGKAYLTATWVVSQNSPFSKGNNIVDSVGEGDYNDWANFIMGDYHEGV